MPRLNSRILLSGLAAVTAGAVTFLGMPMGFVPRMADNPPFAFNLLGLIILAIAVGGWVTDFKRRVAIVWPSRVTLSLFAGLFGFIFVFIGVPNGFLISPADQISSLNKITGLLSIACCVVGWFLIFYRRPEWRKMGLEAPPEDHSAAQGKEPS